MKRRFFQTRAVVLAVLLLGLVFASPAGAVEMLQNTSFESYDAGTLVPDNWQVLDGNVEIFSDYAYDGSASVYSLGGTMIEGVDTTNPPQSGAMAQLIDLSTVPDWAAANWLNLSMSMRYRLWGATRMYMYLEYLPPSYDAEAVYVDDPAWAGADVRIASTRTGTSHARSSTPWYSTSGSNIEIPKVRWARVRFVYDVIYKSNASYFTDGPYYIALDAVSVDAAVIVPADPCTDNLLSNPGFETVSGDEPTNWYVRSGRMTAIDLPVVPPYAGDYYAGNIGGYVAPDLGGDPVNNPDDPQYGTLVQLIDLSTTADWNDAGFMTFTFGTHYLRKGVNGLKAVVEYLPPAYNGATIAWDDAAWDSDAMLALDMTFSNTSGLWKSFQSAQGTLPKTRWARVRLEVDSIPDGTVSNGDYLGGFDQVCFTAAAVVTDALILNPSFEEKDESNKPFDWYEDPNDEPLHLQFEPVPPHDGALYLFKFDDGQGDSTGRVYQVIDLADKIPGWTGIDPATGNTVENQFIKLSLGAHFFNLGGAGVKVGLEYLPYSYNAVDDISWDDAAWAPRAWTSDGTAFTNNGGDAIDLGALIEEATVSTAPVWREVSYDGWLPRVRWIRLRIELDATQTTGTPWVGIDALEMSALGTQWGPYSGFGDLPEATFYENPNAPDKAIPAWIGLEGDGISGGYTGQTEQNYVNPIFAGFADNVADYTPSGQYIYNVAFEDPMAITGRPWNDSGWNYVIVTLGDLSLDYLADYFGPAPSGTYQPGSITAEFNESPIVNGDGPDFATFENGFSSGWTSPWIFAELAYVEVSSNGTDFIRFPTHSLTPKWPGAYGCILASGVFGVTGKHINAYGDAWGTPFDLDWIADDPLVLNGTVDLNNIRYVRQVDIPGGGPDDAQGLYTGFFFDDYGNVIFDSWPTWGSGGSDLDAVAVINTSAADSDGDHISDYWDNCSQSANEKQYDTDGDGFGNMCDCDIDGEEGGDGMVGTADFLVFKAAYGSNGPIMIPGAPGEPNTYEDASENWNPDADFDGDLIVGTSDFLIFKARYGTSIPFE